jgi:hypothetical protein
MKWVVITIAWVLAIGLLVQCRGQVSTATTPEAQSAQPATNTASTSANAQATAPLPCEKAGAMIDRPAAFPAAFPLPPGTAITSQESRSGGRIIIHTLVPALDVKGVAEFFERELPKAGFEITEGESEPGEAEANYQGQGFTGRWKVNTIDGCVGAVTLQVLAGP